MRRRSAIAVLGTAIIGLGIVFPTSAQEVGGDLPPSDAVLFESIEQVVELAEYGPAIIYFHAEWCPTCQATMTSFQARWKEVQPGITLIIADYDQERDLKSRFGVTYQNTYVQVAADGSRLQSWNGGGIEALNDRPIF